LTGKAPGEGHLRPHIGLCGGGRRGSGSGRAENPGRHRTV